MRATRMDGPGLVRAAQAGDRAARDELVAAHLPMVYTIVRQVLGGHPDADDVTQDVMVRALRQLPALRSPESFRPWLAAIALRHVSTHQHRMSRAAAHTAPLDEAVGLADAGAAFEDVTVFEVELSAQRRQVQRAARWLNPEDRALLSLWWLEVAGHLTRAELAEALGVSVIHAGVRVQRMRTQLDLSRTIVAALDARPVCPELDAETAGWDGVAGPLWRKRLARHVRGCPVCLRAAVDLVETDRLLPNLVLLPAPAALVAAVLARSEHTGTAGVGGSGADAVAGAGHGGAAAATGRVRAAAAAHPVVATVAAGALAAGITAVAVGPTRPEEPPPPGVASAASTGTLRTGSFSLESANAAGRFVSVSGDLGMLTQVGPGTTATARRQATFQVVAGLADARCFSFRVQDGRYLRHASWRVRLDENIGTDLFRGDATFCAWPGGTPGTVTLEASNYRGWFLRHRGDELWVDQSKGADAFGADDSFLVRPPLAG
ncbi:sigma-70 family RNA polymerase sigma factor [Actinoplanes sp. CA-252034]|uniref:sigma-70 family RNA polymerase sigma factor n=1 Tax=Actinoplanes sp. CA-252034 TaxID=3239906 RepID=UPI003D950B87